MEVEALFRQLFRQMIRTVTIDIINDKALNLLMDLERLNLIHLRRNASESSFDGNVAGKFKGAMSKQPISEIESQLNDLRSEWE